MKKINLFIILSILSVLSLSIGAGEITFDSDGLNLLLISRIPRLMSILIVGIGMSICGLIMQQISKNKFVSPTTGATIDCAQLGLVFTMLLIPGAGSVGKMVIAFIFAFIGSIIFMRMLRKLQYKNAILVPLIGVMFGNVIGSVTNFFAYKFNLMQSMASFMQGNFSMTLRGNYEMLYITIPLIIIAYIYANKFTIVGMGEDFSTNLGLDYNKVLNIGLFIVSMVTASVVITSGSIPFIGLIVPNIVSAYNGDNVSNNIWQTGMFGAIFVLICDIISRLLIFPYEIPIGLTIGVIGSAIFLTMIMRRNSNAS
ncbi:MAG: iron chelate uptake ABC transporter family permease subunit [Peptostreptococcaceae bacterium]